MRERCGWAGDDPEMRAYHDGEWGRPVHDDRALFEFLVLEGAQAGLSWSTILRKRDGYRRTFDRFDPRKVARYDKHKVAALLADASIVRNRAKIESAIKNAKAFLDLQEEFGTFDAYQWRFVDGRPIQNRGLPAGATFAYRIAPVGVSGTEGPAATSIAPTRGALDVRR